MIKDTLKDIIKKELDANVALKKSGLTKAEVKALADQGDLDAQLVLLLGLVSQDYKTWTEKYVDEDKVSTVVERREQLDSTIFEAAPGEIEALSQKIEALIPKQEYETLRHWRQFFCTDALYPSITKELARRGDTDSIHEMEELAE